MRGIRLSEEDKLMFDLKWSPSEKKIALTAYDAALRDCLEKIMTEFKEKARAVTSASQM
jgi:hypothetical protein